MAVHTWEALEKKYHSWRAPTISVTVDGRPILQREWNLISLQCQLSVEMEAGTCTVTLGNVYDAVKSRFTCEDLLILGSPVEVFLGYVARERVFKGYIYEVSYELGESAEVTVSCMDVKGAMMENSCIAASGSYKEVIRSMFTGPTARGYGVLCGEPAVSLKELERTVTFNTAELDDFGFLRKTAEEWGLECFVLSGELLLRRKPAAAAPLLEFSPGTFHSLSVGFSTVGYVHTVKVRGGTDDERDSEKKRAAAESVNRRAVAPEGTKAARLLKRTAESYAASVLDDRTAQELADAELRRRQKRSGDVRIQLRGLPDLVPGSYAELVKISPKINGKYYITEVTHQFSSSGFTTSAVCRREW